MVRGPEFKGNNASLYLHPDDGEHELEQQRDQHDVADGLDRHDDALHHVLETLGPVDGSEGSEHAQHTENLHHADGPGTAEGGERKQIRRE